MNRCRRHGSGKMPYAVPEKTDVIYFVRRRQKGMKACIPVFMLFLPGQEVRTADKPQDIQLTNK